MYVQLIFYQWFTMQGTSLKSIKLQQAIKVKEGDTMPPIRMQVDLMCESVSWLSTSQVVGQSTTQSYITHMGVQVDELMGRKAQISLHVILLCSKILYHSHPRHVVCVVKLVQYPKVHLYCGSCVRKSYIRCRWPYCE